MDALTTDNACIQLSAMGYMSLAFRKVCGRNEMITVNTQCTVRCTVSGALSLRDGRDLNVVKQQQNEDPSSGSSAVRKARGPGAREGLTSDKRFHKFSEPNGCLDIIPDLGLR